MGRRLELWLRSGLESWNLGGLVFQRTKTPDKSVLRSACGRLWFCNLELIQMAKLLQYQVDVAQAEINHHLCLLCACRMWPISGRL